MYLIQERKNLWKKSVYYFKATLALDSKIQNMHIKAFICVNWKPK